MAERHLRAKPIGLREDTRPAQGKVKHTRNYKEINKSVLEGLRVCMYVCMLYKVPHYYFYLLLYLLDMMMAII